jgi:hypothetical protein
VWSAEKIVLGRGAEEVIWSVSNWGISGTRWIFFSSSNPWRKALCSTMAPYHGAGSTCGEHFWLHQLSHKFQFLQTKLLVLCLRIWGRISVNYPFATKKKINIVLASVTFLDTRHVMVIPNIQGYYKWFIQDDATKCVERARLPPGRVSCDPRGTHRTFVECAENLVSLRFVSYINRICTCNTLDNIAFWKRINHL